MFDAIMFFIMGTCVFCIGLTAGWAMRGSVKEEELQKYRSLHDKFDKQKWTLEDINKKLRTGK